MGRGRAIRPESPPALLPGTVAARLMWPPCLVCGRVWATGVSDPWAHGV
jgi:hypothetical protein